MIAVRVWGENTIMGVMHDPDKDACIGRIEHLRYCPTVAYAVEKLDGPLHYCFICYPERSGERFESNELSDRFL